MTGSRTMCGKAICANHADCTQIIFIPTEIRGAKRDDILPGLSGVRHERMNQGARAHHPVLVRAATSPSSSASGSQDQALFFPHSQIIAFQTGDKAL